MSYLVIFPDGSITKNPHNARIETIKAIVGEPGYARVNLAESWGLVGWVNDCGLVDNLPRNPAGACVLASLGARQQPYAGPVVITGYDYDSESGNPESINPAQTIALDNIVAAVTAILNDKTPTTPNPGSEWIHQAKEYAKYVSEVNAPQITIVDNSPDHTN